MQGTAFPLDQCECNKTALLMLIAAAAAAVAATASQFGVHAREYLCSALTPVDRTRASSQGQVRCRGVTSGGVT